MDGFGAKLVGPRKEFVGFPFAIPFERQPIRLTKPSQTKGPASFPGGLGPADPM